MTSMWADVAPPPNAPASAPVPASSESATPLSAEQSERETEAAPLPHPYLSEPKLYVGGITEAVPDEDIVNALAECLRLRPMIGRASGSSYADASGYIEFEEMDKAEKAYASANSFEFPAYNCSLSLHAAEPPAADPAAPSTVPRLFKNLPLSYTAGALYDICRPYGPVHRASLVLAPSYPPGSGPAKFKGQGQVIFYKEEHAAVATHELHCAEIEGNTITMQKFDPLRVSKSRPAQSQWAVDAEPFIPSGMPSTPAASPLAQANLGYGRPGQQDYPSPPMERDFSGASFTSSGSNHGGVRNSVDPCNLFVKSLDPSITSADLHRLFSPFGTIVSARVMEHEASHVSKEFGFVAFQNAFEAQEALHAMDGAKFGRAGKGIVVRLHEPRKLREERKASHVGGTNTPPRGLDEQLAAHSLAETHYDSDRSYPSSPTLSRSPSTGIPISSPGSSTLTDSERLLQAVRKLQPDRAEEIVELLEGLSKKERAMCLFNPSHLQLKVRDALTILSPDSDSDEALNPSGTTYPLPTPASTPKAALKRSLRAPATLEALGHLPVKEIYALLEAGLLRELCGLSGVVGEKEKSTTAFMEGLEGRPVHEVKQKLGDRVFKVVKAMGIKGAPKLTIQLLDTEELVPLAHLTDYPDVLKERVLAIK